MSFFLRVLALLVVTTGVVRAQVPADRLEKSIARGDSLYALFENEAALRAYERGLVADSTHFGLLYRLSRTANDFGQDLLATDRRQEADHVMGKATSYAEMMQRHHPDRPETWFQMAATWGNRAIFMGGKDKVRMGRNVEAYANRALELDPDYAYALLALGIFYRELGSLNWIQQTFANTFFGGLPEGGNEKAIRFLSRALEEDPTLVMTHFELAETYRAEGNDELATYHYGRVLDLTPINTEELRQQRDARRILADS
jgi:tetratricopeptide (TPR) repeat protein